MTRLPKLVAMSLLLGALATFAGCGPDAAAAGESRQALPIAMRAAAPTGVTSGPSIYGLTSDWRDQMGDTIQLSSLAGRVRVVAMVYTSCAATCPLIVADLKRIESSLPEHRRDAVGFVLVSLDPDRDSHDRLAEWAAQTRLHPARWTLLNGDDSAIRELAATLDVRYQAQVDGEFAHSNGITVLDADGVIAHQQTTLGDPDRTTAAAVLRLVQDRPAPVR